MLLYTCLFAATGAFTFIFETHEDVDQTAESTSTSSDSQRAHDSWNACESIGEYDMTGPECPFSVIESRAKLLEIQTHAYAPDGDLDQDGSILANWVLGIVY
jgi:hypothetical protein